MMPASDGSKSDKQDMNPGKCDLSECTSGSKSETDKESVHNYPDYNGKFSELDDQGYNTSAGGGFQSDVSNGSEALPCYIGDLANEMSKSSINKIASVKSNGFNSVTTSLKSKSQQSPVKTNSSESMMESHPPLKTWGKVGSGEGSQSADSNRNFSQLDDQGYSDTISEGSSDAIGSRKSCVTAGKFSSFTSQNHVKGSQQPADKSPRLISQTPVNGSQPFRKYPLLISQTPVKGFQNARKIPPWTGQNQGNFVHKSSMNYRPNHKASNENMKNKQFDASKDTTRGPRIQNTSNQGNFVHNSSTNYRPNHKASNESMKHRRFDALNDITRGPRIQNTSNPTNLKPKDTLELTLDRNKYNREDFVTDYPDAKFYVIKSYSEDDVYKCIKYDVWASTHYGNKKLNDAFLDVMAKSNETCTKCPPTFLFFSVNGSGQFLGVAEMIGRIDFNKTMDFWQVDRWNGFFPVKWHVLKDIPNAKLRHIILKNNDNKDVTFTRDTQEIELEQGIEMLKIFKNYEGKTSLLDDVEFYENRIKLAREKAKSMKKKDPESETYRDFYGEDYQDYGEDYKDYGEDYKDYGEDFQEHGVDCQDHVVDCQDHGEDYQNYGEEF
ncbi:YTH domain-containing family protein 3-like isoform X2 [Impatiens glandulifera]|uniref:YTH domain-containing family protein 3-like isoform X2 n=1 Tax=Impatiens glandulifera TaxID=253017 RepID=UPI001FB19871|nr:YTH domain-containing family protein 3-like isoform X2 [Impatiens glandulifera]